MQVVRHEFGGRCGYELEKNYDELSSKFLKQHFGSAQGLTHNFPCMRNNYPWGKHRPSVADSRVPAKNNTEYHGLERYASQYHVTAQYEYAYHHWLIAAAWRKEDMDANNFSDMAHKKALEYTIRQALYNKSLFKWQQDHKTKKTPVPKPEEFGLNESDLEKKDASALSEIEKYAGNNA